MSAFDGLAETALEWWDVVDDGKNLVYQPTLFRHATTDVAGQLCPFGWDGDDEELAESLHAAHAQVKESGVKCALARFDFQS